LRWGTPTPKVGVAVSSVRGTSSHAYRDFQTVKDGGNRLGATYLSRALRNGCFVDQHNGRVLGLHVDSNVIAGDPTGSIDSFSSTLGYIDVTLEWKNTHRI
jgi:hypothetical protein